MKTPINIIYYVSLTFSFLIYLLPSDYILAVYSLSILGWVWIVVLLPLTVITYIWAGIINYKQKNWKDIKVRSLLLLTTIVVGVGYRFYVAYGHGNL